MRCCDCNFWGEGDGTGFNYDAGAVNYCKQPQIAGRQHPSQGGADYSGKTTSMVIVDGSDRVHQILTRRNFGCIMFVSNKNEQRTGSTNE